MKQPSNYSQNTTFIIRDGKTYNAQGGEL